MVGEGAIRRSFELTDDIVLDLDGDGNVVGIDIMPFTAIFPALSPNLKRMRQEWVPA